MNGSGVVLSNGLGGVAMEKFVTCCLVVSYVLNFVFIEAFKISKRIEIALPVIVGKVNSSKYRSLPVTDRTKRNKGEPNQ